MVQINKQANETAVPVPYVFVVGCPRSGTTMLQRMMDCHPQLAMIDEAHFIPIPFRGHWLRSDPPLTREQVDQVRRFYHFDRLGLSDAQVLQAVDKSKTYGEFVSRLYATFAELRDKPLVGEKAPYYVRYVQILNTLFPKARIVHIIRDGRDVALSVMQWAPRKGKGPVARYSMGKEEPVGLCALWWEKRVRAAFRDGRGMGNALYLEIRYEQLVVEPVKVLGEIARFLGLADGGEMARYHIGKTRNEQGLSAKEAWLPPTPGLRNWRMDMSERDLALFEALAGDLLAELGYECLFPKISPTIETAASRCREMWKNSRTGKARTWI